MRFRCSLSLISPPHEQSHPHPLSSAGQPRAAPTSCSSTRERFWGAKSVPDRGVGVSATASPSRRPGQSTPEGPVPQKLNTVVPEWDALIEPYNVLPLGLTELPQKRAPNLPSPQKGVSSYRSDSAALVTEESRPPVNRALGTRQCQTCPLHRPNKKKFKKKIKKK